MQVLKQGHWKSFSIFLSGLAPISGDAVAAMTLQGRNSSGKRELLFPTSSTKLLDLLQLAHLDHRSTSEGTAVAEEINSSDWLARVPPPELEDGITHLEPQGLRVGEEWFLRKIRGVVTKRKRDGCWLY